MKRIFSALVLAVVLVSLLTYSIFFVKDSCKESHKLLDECTSAYMNGERDGKAAKNLEKYWSKKEKPLSVFVHHEKIDEIEKALHCLVIYSKTDEQEIFKEYSATVEILLHQLLEDTLPGVHSIL